MEFYRVLAGSLRFSEREVYKTKIMQTTIYFKMQKTEDVEKVIFNGDPRISEISDYFENSCGGVYRWWVYLDKSTAIRFSKQIRTEINKIKESEGQNG